MGLPDTTTPTTNLPTIVVKPSTVTNGNSPAALQNPAAGTSGAPIPPGGTLATPPAGGTPSVGNIPNDTILGGYGYYAPANLSSGTSTPTSNNPVNSPGSNPVNSPGSNAVNNNAYQIVPPSCIPNPSPALQNLSDAAGRRVRLRPKPNAMAQILGSTGLMTPLNNTTGMLFPYQPTITWSQEVSYTAMEIVHANQDFYSYNKTPALKLTVEGDFTVQNQSEGQYALACIHFLRTVTKMWFGSSGSSCLAGTPPPVLLFDAYGQWMFNALPVIVTQFSVTLPKDVDYVPVQTAATAGVSSLSQSTLSTSAAAAAFNSITNPTAASSISQGFAWLPAVFSISVSLTVQNTPQRLRAFDLNQFRSGQLLTQGSWI